MARPSKDEYFINIAKNVAKRSTCTRRAVGAVAINIHGAIVSTGYNGAPRNLVHCTPESCLRNSVPSGERHELCRGVHAEQNVIAQAALHGSRLRGCTVYSTHKPCFICAKMLLNAGVVFVKYLEDYPDTQTDNLLNELGYQFFQRVDIYAPIPMITGLTDGDICNRNGCTGIIQLRPPENCSCHLHPPCSACVSPRNYCPECGWEESDDVEI